MPSVRSRVLFFLLVDCRCVGAACREEGDIQISSLDFDGVEQVDKGALASALQTQARLAAPVGAQAILRSPRVRGRPETDRGLLSRPRIPGRARRRRSTSQLNDAQDKVDVTVTISEGEPIVVSAIELTGFDVLPEDERAVARRRRSRCGSSSRSIDSSPSRRASAR